MLPRSPSTSVRSQSHRAEPRDMPVDQSIGLQATCTRRDRSSCRLDPDGCRGRPRVSRRRRRVVDRLTRRGLLEAALAGSRSASGAALMACSGFRLARTCRPVEVVERRELDDRGSSETLTAVVARQVVEASRTRRWPWSGPHATRSEAHRRAGRFDIARSDAGGSGSTGARSSRAAMPDDLDSRHERGPPCASTGARMSVEEAAGRTPGRSVRRRRHRCWRSPSNDHDLSSGKSCSL